MGVGLVMFIWLMIAGVFGFYWIAGVFIFLLGLFKRSPAPMMVGGFLVAGVTLVAITAASLVGFGIIRALIDSL